MSVRKVPVHPLVEQLHVLEAEYQTAFAACPERQRGELAQLRSRIDAVRAEAARVALQRRVPAR